MELQKGDTMWFSRPTMRGGRSAGCSTTKCRSIAAEARAPRATNWRLDEKRTDARGLGILLIGENSLIRIEIVD